MVRFFVEEAILLQKQIVLEAENAGHAKVLRLKAGDEVILCDGNGQEAVCELLSTGPEYLLKRGEVHCSETEPAARVSIYMAFPKADKLEHVIQKATELGVHEIVTFPTARCVSRPDEKSIKKKLERWQKIAASAAEQSGRGKIPQILVLPNYPEALNRASRAELSILFYENERSNTLHRTLTQTHCSSISILTGPEGGLEEEEVKQALKAGLQVCTLGRRILRCETAPLCALSAIMYASGEF